MTDIFKDVNGVGHSVGRQLEARLAGDTDSFRTVVINDGSGEVILRTKGGMPEVTKTATPSAYKKPGKTPARSFVFRKLSDALPSVGRVAKRLGSTMKVIHPNYSIQGVTGYCVGKVRTKNTKYAEVKYNDVYRLSGTKFSINDGAVSTPAFNWVQGWQPGYIPYVVRNAYGKYQQFAGGAPGDRTTLYVGTTTGVSSIANGMPMGEVSFDRTYFDSAYDAGLHCSTDGVFTLCGGKIELGRSYWSLPGHIDRRVSFVRRITISTSSITATFNPPYLQSNEGAVTALLYDTLVPGEPPPAQLRPDLEAILCTSPVVDINYKGATEVPMSRAVSASIVSVNPDGSVQLNLTSSGGAVTNFTVGRNPPLRAKPNIVISGVRTERFSEGAPLEIEATYTVNASSSSELTVDNVWLYDPTTGPNNARQMFQGSKLDYLGGSCTNTVSYKLVADPAMLIMEGTATKNIAPGSGSASYSKIIGWEEMAVNTTFTTSLAQAEATISGYAGVAYYRYTYSGENYSREPQETTTVDYTTRDFIFCDPDEKVYVYLEVNVNPVINAKYVVSFRGVKTDFPITTNMSLSSLAVQGLTDMWYSHRFISDNGTFDHDVSDPNIRVPHVHCAAPPPFICAPFTSQNNCPYIAYTTKEEELRGATPEIYVDFSVTPCRPLYWSGNASSKYAGNVKFLALQLNLIAFNMTDHTYGYYIDEMFPWNDVTGAATPFRIQMANNVAGPWQGQLGTPFVDGEQLEITRT